MNEHEARVAYVKFEYTRVVTSVDSELSPKDIEFARDLAEEYMFATGKEIEPLTDAELAEWYAKTGPAVEEVLDYVQY